MSRHVLITGANGLLGARLVRALAGNSAVRVTATWRNRRELLSLAAGGNVVPRRVDLRDPAAVRALFADAPVDVVVHAAAEIGRESDIEFLERARDNVVATSNLFGATLAARCRCVIFCSSISVYGGTSPEGGYTEDQRPDPAGFYGWSKWAGEEALRRACALSGSLCGVSLRLAGIHGPGRRGGVVFAMARAALSGRRLEVTEPESRFRWLFVDDAVAAIVALMASRDRLGYEVFNVASRDAVRLLEAAECLVELAGTRSRIACVQSAAARSNVMDIGRLQRAIGYTPRGLRDGLAEILADAHERV